MAEEARVCIDLCAVQEATNAKRLPKCGEFFHDVAPLDPGLTLVRADRPAIILVPRQMH